MESIISVLYIISITLLFFIIIKEQELINVIFKIILYVILLTIFILCLIYWSKPTAMDVYKGKTTLEITYKDTVPIDSTVVWKSK